MSKEVDALDLICLGRAAVDLYGEQLNSPLEDVSSFAKSLGGCAANIAAGCARQGLAVAMLTRVGDEHMGRFVRGALAREGVDVSGVKTDPERLTGLVLLSIRDRNTFPLIFYRERCADMALCEDDIDPALFARTKTLLLTGTHLSTERVAAASRLAMKRAKEAGARVVLDIDYRPVLWGLTGHGFGESRYVEDRDVTEHLGVFLADCDLVVGTQEEIHIAGGSADTLKALIAIRAKTEGTIVMKRGPLGCVIFEGAIPSAVEEGLVVQGVPVEVLNVLGAGDAFMSGFLRGWINGAALSRCAQIANAAGALVVSRHACTPAMPSKAELDDYLARAAQIERIDLDADIARLHRKTTRPARQDLAVLAFDHRAQLSSLGDRAQLVRLKALICEAAVQVSVAEHKGSMTFGAIIDDVYGAGALSRLTGQGWWLGRPVERPGPGPLRFESEPNVELHILKWPKEQVVKCLLRYHPDQPEEVRAKEEAALVRLHRACVTLERSLLLELIPGDATVDTRALPAVMERFYALDVQPEWWKLPPPADDETWARISELIEAKDPHCDGVLLLGLDASFEALETAFSRAASWPIASGFAVGRTIFLEPAKRWIAGTLSDEALVRTVAEGFEQVVQLWRARTST